MGSVSISLRAARRGECEVAERGWSQEREGVCMCVYGERGSRGSWSSGRWKAGMVGWRVNQGRRYSDLGGGGACVWMGRQREASR